MKACIATSKRPTDFTAFLKAVKELAEEDNIQIQGYVVTGGYGCLNHGIMFEGKNYEKFLNSLTMALQPGKWSMVSDNDPGVNENQFAMIDDSDKAPPADRYVDMDYVDTGIMTHPDDMYPELVPIDEEPTSRFEPEDIKWIKENYPGFMLNKEHGMSDEEHIEKNFNKSELPDWYVNSIPVTHIDDSDKAPRKAIMPHTLEQLLEKLTMDQAFMLCRYLDSNPNAQTDMIEVIMVSHPDLKY